MSRAYDAVIFDLDGTLIDSQPAHEACWKAALMRQGIELDERQLRLCLGLTSPQFAARIEKILGRSIPDVELAIREKRRLYFNRFEELVRPIDGAAELLQRLHGRYRLALCTTAGLRVVGQTLKRMNWRGVFEVVTAIDHVPAPKPDPEIYRFTLDRLKLESSRALAFEDSPAGIQSALGARLDAVAIASTYDAPLLLEHGAHCVFENCADPGINAILP
ncbi:HAD family phosphatase [Candidatus Sumerlaeota bacterium]|nr:HAD family phosphatase [Candidatus Sumerlaeota bacterium]